MEDLTLNKFKTLIEKDLVFKLIMELRHGEISSEKAQLLAREFMVNMPTNTKKDMVFMLQILAGRHLEFLDLFLKYADVLENEIKNQTFNLAVVLAKQGDIDKALETAKGGDIWKK